MLKLYELTEEYRKVLEWIEDHEEELAAAGGELPERITAQLDAIEGAVEDKAENIALVLDELDANYLGAKAKADRLTKLARSYKRGFDGLREYLRYHLTANGYSKIETSSAVMSIVPNSQCSITSADPSAIHEDFRLIKVTGQGNRTWADRLEKAAFSVGIIPPTMETVLDKGAVAKFLEASDEGGFPDPGEELVLEGTEGTVRIKRGQHLRIR